MMWLYYNLKKVSSLYWPQSLSIGQLECSQPTMLKKNLCIEENRFSACQQLSNARTSSVRNGTLCPPPQFMLGFWSALKVRNNIHAVISSMRSSVQLPSYIGKHCFLEFIQCPYFWWLHKLFIICAHIVVLIIYNIYYLTNGMFRWTQPQVEQT